MSRQVSFLRGAAAQYTVEAGQARQFALPDRIPLGYAALVGSCRSTHDVSVYLLQGKLGDRWISGAGSAVDVTGAALDEANDGSGAAFGWSIVSADAVLVVENAGEDEATILLEQNLVGSA